MPESLVTRVLAAAVVLEELQGEGSVTSMNAYSPADLRRIVKMMQGGSER